MTALPILTAALMFAGPVAPASGCVWIRAENDGSGAGFLVDAKKRRVVTCRHVVADRDTVDVYFAWTRDGSLLADKSEYLGNRTELRECGLLVRGRVVKKSDDADLALVELESLPDGATPLPFSSTPVQPGDSLRAVGHRIDLDTLFNLTRGSVRQTGRLANGYSWRGRKLAVNADAILGQLPIEEGDSGGPVLNDRGDVVGMVSALRRQTPSAAVAISAAEIRKFVGVAEPKSDSAKPGIGDTLMRCTVWVRPTATEVHLAGALVEKNLILTSARGLGSSNSVGIAFPLRENDRWIGERAPYRDPVGLHLKRVWRVGTVLARDLDRDLAVIRIESVPEDCRPVPLAEKKPAPGDAVHAMSHPGGIEFAWVYASGSVRQHGRLALAEGEKPVRVETNVLQLPAQSGSPGGPILNDRGELIGVLSARESAQQTGYAATTDEIARFLDVALTNRPANTVPGLIARIEAIPVWMGKKFADSLWIWSFQRPEAERESINRLALILDPGCIKARDALWGILQRSGRSDEAKAVLDRGIERDDGYPGWLYVRAVRSMSDREEWQSARGDLERALATHPEQYGIRAALVRALLQLNKDDEAEAAVRDVVRSQPDGIRFLAADLLAQTDELAKRYPDTPSVPLKWLKRAIGTAQKVEPDPQRKAECEVVLKAVAAAADDAARLKLLRAFLAKLKSPPGR